MKPRIALCMIVKNESHIIHECLNTIYKYPTDRKNVFESESVDREREG